jgi:hypothetical protein
LFVNESPADAIRWPALKDHIVSEPAGVETGQYFNGITHLESFVSDEALQHLEGQIFAYGSDFRNSYRTLRSTQCPDEITIASPGDQIPVIGDLVAELDSVIETIVPWRFRRCMYQLRLYEPRYGGHPRHVDYAPGFTISGRDGVRRGITSLSFSLPISWNGGAAPPFILEDEGKEVVQDQPGSLVIFGPRVLHSHPSAPALSCLYAWLIGQAYYEFDVK